VRFLLDFLYTGSVELETSNAETLYIAGQDYQLPRLTDLAEAFLESEVPSLACPPSHHTRIPCWQVSPPRLVQLLEFAERYEASRLHTACLRYVAMLPEVLSETSELSSFVSDGGIACLFELLAHSLQQGKLPLPPGGG
jgi:hypothetical protein